MEDFAHRMVQTSPGSIVLLPSPMVVIARVADEVRLFGPHARVWHLEDLPEADALWCSPNLIKVLLGDPRRFVNRGFSTAELPLLLPFEEHPPERWPQLLADLRASVPLHFDEAYFLQRWRSLLTDRVLQAPEAMSQRQEERIFLRYAGQTPASIVRELRLATQLAADMTNGAHTPLGQHADQSHYIRGSRKLTGRPPTYWLRTVASPYGWDGTPVLRPAARDTTS